MSDLNPTHDPARKSWIDSANTADTDFPIQNLPYGVFSTASGGKRIGVAIGDQILDLTAAENAGLVRPLADQMVFDTDVLNPFMELGPDVWTFTRSVISNLLEEGNPTLRDQGSMRERVLVPMSDATMHLSIFVRSFTDFYSSKEHASNVGAILRGGNSPLMPNWTHIPIGYNGRATTVVVSGTDFHRPSGQLKGPDDEMPRFAPSAKLDIELEMGAVVGIGNAMGQRITPDEAYSMIFGYVLLNDWSARDIQAWEYQPLGPFQSKAFATTISPWVVTTEALAPHRVPTPDRLNDLLPYLREDGNNNFDLALDVEYRTAEGTSAVVSRSNYKYMYYSAAQQLAHHASSGCAMMTGDLLGSGTISGPDKASMGSFLEASWNGTEPMDVGGVERSFLQDGDEVVITGHCAGDGHRIGFGDCAGKVLPAT